MRTAMIVFTVVAAACGTGCAAGGGPAMVHQSTGKHAVDQLYVAQVEQIAQKRGVEVRWVNPPVTETRHTD